MCGRERGLASSASHIDQMGRPYRSDVSEWAQSNVQWWMSIRSAGRACSCGFVVDDRLQISQTKQTRRALENVNRANMESVRGGTVWDSR